MNKNATPSEQFLASNEFVDVFRIFRGAFGTAPFAEIDFLFTPDADKSEIPRLGATHLRNFQEKLLFRLFKTDTRISFLRKRNERRRRLSTFLTREIPSQIKRLQQESNLQPSASEADALSN